MRARARAVGLAEAVEHVGQEIGGDALPGVLHDDDRRRGGALQPHLDASAARRELDGVRQQVPDHLLQAVGIRVHGPALRLQRGVEHDALALGGGTDGVQRGLDDGGRLHRAHVQAQLAGDDARDVQQVLDELALRACVALDGLQRARRGGLVEPAAAQRDRPAEHGIERRAQLVGERGEELVLDPVGGLGLGARPLLARQELRVADGDGRVVGEQAQHLLVMVVERPRRAVVDVEQALDAAADGDGHHHQRGDALGGHGGAIRRIAGEAWVARDVVAAHGRARGHHEAAGAMAGHARVLRRVLAAPSRPMAEHHGAGLVAQGDGRQVAGAEIAGALGDDLEEIAQVERGVDGARQVAEQGCAALGSLMRSSQLHGRFSAMIHAARGRYP